MNNTALKGTTICTYHKLKKDSFNTDVAILTFRRKEIELLRKLKVAFNLYLLQLKVKFY